MPDPHLRHAASAGSSDRAGALIRRLEPLGNEATRVRRERCPGGVRELERAHRDRPVAFVGDRLVDIAGEELPGATEKPPTDRRAPLRATWRAATCNGRDVTSWLDG